MKLRTKNTPPVGVYIPSEHFNVLITILNQFADTENQIGETFYSQNSEKLKQKIFQFGRAYSSKDSKNAALFLYGKEAAVLIEMLIAYSSFFANPHQDYYADFKIAYENKNKK